MFKLTPERIAQLDLQAKKNARDIAEISAKIRELREMTHNLREKMDKAEAMIRKAEESFFES